MEHPLDSKNVGKKSGVIDLPSLFLAIARELAVAAERGRILHRTHNIRDSGAPLEALFRHAIGSRLPSPYRVLHGYLFDADSVCTPQIDALVIDGSDSHEIMTSSEGASYVPYTSAHAIIELKTSAKNIAGHLDQLMTTITALHAMSERHVAAGRLLQQGPVYEAPTASC